MKHFSQLFLCSLWLVACTESGRPTPVEEPAVGAEAIRACIVGVWERPTQACRCELAMTPECDAPDCEEGSISVYTEDAVALQYTLRRSASMGSVVSVRGVFRGDWFADDDSLSVAFGAGNNYMDHAVTCRPSELVWASPSVRVDPVLEALVLEHLDEDSWRADYVPGAS